MGPHHRGTRPTWSTVWRSVRSPLALLLMRHLLLQRVHAALQIIDLKRSRIMKLQYVFNLQGALLSIKMR